MTNSPDGSIPLLDPERNELYFSAARGEKAGVLLEKLGKQSKERVPLTGSVAGDTFTSRTIKTLDRAEREHPGVFLESQLSMTTQPFPTPRCDGRSLGIQGLLHGESSVGKRHHQRDTCRTHLDSVGEQLATVPNPPHLREATALSLCKGTRKQGQD
jgi:hypothetical protein